MPPTTEHEVLGDLFRKHPGFAAELLRDLLGVLEVLAARRIDVPEEVRRRITTCTDLDLK